MARVARPGAPDTATAILDIAEGLVQRRGFNGFSYADIALELGVTKASLHYHFAGKAELGENLVTRYTTRFTQALDALDARPTSAPAKLAAYCDIYRTVLTEHRMCLCGMLAAEYETLPVPMRRAVLAFFEQNERWLSAFLDEGRATGALRFEGSARDAARGITAALEGAMLIARPYGSTAVLDSVASGIVKGFAPPS